MKVISNRNNIFLLEEIVKRNFASKYKDSVVGIFWSILKPLLMMVVFTIIFSALFSGSIEYFAVYYLSGRCVYEFFMTSVSSCMYVISSNQNIIQKTPVPKHIFILGAIISEFLNFIISLIILVAVMIVTGCPFHFETMFLSIIPTISLILIILGLGFLLSILSVYYKDIIHLWSVISLIIMYSSALFYPMDIIPEPYKSVMILNPFYWIITQFREFFIYGTLPNTLNLINALLISLIIFVIGIIVFKKYQNKVIMKL